MAKLEVHEHCYITGPNSRFAGHARSRLVHAHEGGDQPHEHVDATHRTGPGSYTIDKDEWHARTGLRGGGRKRFVTKPTGEQMPFVAREPSRIDIVIHGDGGAAAARGGQGPGLAVVDRMVLGFKARVHSVTTDPGTGRKASR
jgi:hypothetical protein